MVDQDTRTPNIRTPHNPDTQTPRHLLPLKIAQNALSNTDLRPKGIFSSNLTAASLQRYACTQSLSEEPNQLETTFQYFELSNGDLNQTFQAFLSILRVPFSLCGCLGVFVVVWFY